MQQLKSSFIKNSSKTILALLSGTILLGLFNSLFFNTAVYSRLLLPDSAAGQVMLMINAERTRVAVNAANSTAILFGDSRLAEGFSAKTANVEAIPKGLEVVNAAIPSTTPRCWYYFLNKLDPSNEKYDYIALGIPSLSKLSSDDLQDRILDLDYIAPIAGLQDIPQIMDSFSTMESKANTFRYLALKGFVYKYDLQDFLARPRARFKFVLNPYQSVGWSHNYEYPGRPESLAGVTWDQATQKVNYPADFTKEKRDFIEKYIDIVRQTPNIRNLNYYVYWLSRILKKYENTKTRVIVFQMPSGPLPTTDKNAAIFPEIEGLKQTYSHLTVLPAGEFRNLEAPELFFDYLHLNSAGRQKLSKDLTGAILAIHQIAIKE